MRRLSSQRGAKRHCSTWRFWALRPSCSALTWGRCSALQSWTHSTSAWRCHFLSATSPVTNVQFTEQDNIWYEADSALGSSWTHTRLQLRIPSDAGPEWAGFSSFLEIACGTDGLGVAINGIGLASPAFISGNTAEVTWRVGNGPPQRGTWDVWPFAGDRHSISPQDDAAFYAAIQGVDSLSVSVASEPVFTQTYDFAANDFWTTPVQPNLDACGGPLVGPRGKGGSEW